MNILKIIAIGLVLFALGIGMGYYLSPERIKTVEKIVEKEVTKIVHEKYDPVTGKVIERTETDSTKKTTEKKTTEKTLKTKKHYALKGGVAIDPRDGIKLIPRVGAEVRLPFFDSWAGLEGDINLARPIVGVYLRLEF